MQENKKPFLRRILGWMASALPHLLLILEGFLLTLLIIDIINPAMDFINNDTTKTIMMGTCILAFGLQCFYDPIGLVTGGFTGLAIVIKSVTGMLCEGGIPLWFTNLALNVPVFILSYFLKGSKFIGKTLFGTIMLSVWLYLLPIIDMAQGDYMIASIFGGVCAGAGIGFVIRVGATTGGTDMVAALVQLKLRHYSIVQILQVIDAIVVIIGFVVFDLRATLYAIIGIVVQTKVADLIVEGFNYSKAAYIISDKHEIFPVCSYAVHNKGVTYT